MYKQKLTKYNLIKNKVEIYIKVHCNALMHCKAHFIDIS